MQGTHIVYSAFGGSYKGFGSVSFAKHNNSLIGKCLEAPNETIHKNRWAYIAVWEKIGRPYSSDRNEITEKETLLYKFELNRYFGFKNTDGKIVIEPKYYFANDFSDNSSMVAIEPKAFHHINTRGQRLYDKNYYFGFNFKNDIAKVVTNCLDLNPFTLSRWDVDYYIFLKQQNGVLLIKQGMNIGITNNFTQQNINRNYRTS